MAGILRVLVLTIALAALTSAAKEFALFFEDKGFRGESLLFTFEKCENLPVEFNDRVSSVDTRDNCIRIWDKSCCQGNSTVLYYGSPYHTDLSALGWDDKITAVSPCGNYTSESPSVLRENWFGHSELVEKFFEDPDITIYYDNGMGANKVTWTKSFVGDVWRYVKATYGNFGPENGKLYSIFHYDDPELVSSAQTYFDESSNCRNVIDLFSPDKKVLLSGEEHDLDLVTLEIGRIVERASNGVSGSPSFRVWGTGKWSEIFIYDVYRGLNMTKDRIRWHSLMLESKEPYPRRDTYWYRDWFYPIYIRHGGTNVMIKYLTLLSKNYPRDQNDNHKYQMDRDLNFGEFVHFWSGAAGKNLKDLAEEAFGWTIDYEFQLVQAKQQFPNVTYTAINYIV